MKDDSWDSVPEGIEPITQMVLDILMYCCCENLASDEIAQDEREHHAKLVKYLVDWVSNYKEMKSTIGEEK